MLTPTVLDLTQNMQPNNFYNITHPGAQFASDFAGVTTTTLLGPSTSRKIVDSYNKQFLSTMFMMSLPKVECDDFEDEWYEKPYLIGPVTVRATAVAVPNATTSYVEQVVPVTDAAYDNVAIDHKLLYPDTQTHGIVVLKAGNLGARTITVRSYEGFPLPQVTAGQELGNSGPRNSDGQAMPTSSFRGSVARYSNYMEQLGYFACSWDPMDSVRWDNKGRTDFKQKEHEDVRKRYFASIMQTILTGSGGRTSLTNTGRRTLSTKGLLKQQADAGVSITPITPANALDAIRDAIYDNQMDDAESWVLAGPSRLLDKISLGEKSEKLRYQVGDQVYDTSLSRYQFTGGHSVTPLPLNHMEDRGLYGSGLANDLIMFRQSDLKLTYMKNWPMFSNGYKLANNQNSNPVTGFANIDMVFYSAFFGVRFERAWSSARFRMPAV